MGFSIHKGSWIQLPVYIKGQTQVTGLPSAGILVSCSSKISPISFHQNNTRLHASLTTGQKLLQLSWEVLIHPPYSPDNATSDVHLFQLLQNSLNRKNFNSLQDCKRYSLEQFFVQNNIKFWEDEIMKLPEKWQKVLEQSNDSTTQ